MSGHKPWSEIKHKADAQNFERNWWGNCVNTLGEERKQLVYAQHMGIIFNDTGGPGPVHFLAGASVLDIGGGPCSMLLKVEDGGKLKVIDPLPIPEWCKARYEAAGIEYVQQGAEQGVDGDAFDEVWIYNALQHVEDPERVLAVARQAGQLLRVFEWVDIPAHEGHPHELTVESLNRWAGFEGYRVEVNWHGAVGSAWVGIGFC